MPVCDLCTSFCLTGNLCGLCMQKSTAERFQKAKNMNLQLNTIDEMIGRFVIDDHQAKHYAGGNRRYAHFESTNENLAWDSVHKLIVFCTRQILTAQKNAGLIHPADGYVEFTGLNANRYWYAGSNKGTTNVVMVQLSIALDGFSGHGYPLDTARAGLLVNDPNYVTTTTTNWATVTLGGANNSKRTLQTNA